jgi:hypothetical protein
MGRLAYVVSADSTQMTAHSLCSRLCVATWQGDIGPETSLSGVKLIATYMCANQVYWPGTPVCSARSWWTLLECLSQMRYA